MSLKAKLEAVIYAAEEPVTLAQLTALFANEALEWKAEREAAAKASAGEQLPLTGVEGEAVEPLNEALAPQEFEPGGEGEDAAAAATEATAEASEGAKAEAGTEDAAATADGETPSEADEAAAEAEAKKQAKAREREARGTIKLLLEELITEYTVDGRGIEIREIAGGYRMATKPEFHDAVRSFVKSLKAPMKLSLPALETLAVIAYKQPVTAPEVNEIRGVDSSGVFGSLLARKLIATAGRKQVVGRPILYKTTKEFLLRFGLKDVTELPSMEEFEKMAASELAEGEDAPEEAATEAANEAAAEFNPDTSVETADGEGTSATAIEENSATAAEAEPTPAAEDAAHPTE